MRIKEMVDGIAKLQNLYYAAEGRRVSLLKGTRKEQASWARCFGAQHAPEVMTERQRFARLRVATARAKRAKGAIKALRSATQAAIDAALLDAL